MSELIPEPILDPRNEQELAAGAIQRSYEASNGQLNITDAHNPMAALHEGFAYSGAELLWYVNKLPRALAVAFMKISGIERRPGTVARVTLEFKLTTAYTRPVTIPAGFEVKQPAVFSRNGDQVPQVFSTLAPLTIPAGSTSGTVEAVCTQVGPLGNVPAQSLSVFTTPLSFLSSVTNPSAATGGELPETLQETETRILADIRSRDILISAIDYELFVTRLLGQGSRAVVVPLLAADRVARQAGTVHVFGVMPTGTLPDADTMTQVQQELNEHTPLGTSVYFSPAELEPVDIKAVCSLSPSESAADPGAIANAAFELLQREISPQGFQSGESHIVLNDIEFSLRQVNGIKRVFSVVINGLGTNYLLDKVYKLPVLRSAYIELVDSVGNTYTFGFGEGDRD